MLTRFSRGAPSLRSCCAATAFTPVVNQSRGVVVKRAFDPPLVKGKMVTQEMIDKSVPDNLLYLRYQVLEKETELEETVPPIQIILIKSIEEFGKKGQVLTMASERAHKELLFHGLAVYASPENLEAYKDIIIPEDAVQFSSKSIQKAYPELSRKAFCLKMHDVNPWTVEKWHLRLALRERGVFVDSDDCISFNAKPISGPNPALQGKEFRVTLKVNSLEQIPLRFVIYQDSEKVAEDNVSDEDGSSSSLSTGSGDLLAPPQEIPPRDWDSMFNEPVFEEERQQLELIPRQHIDDDVIKANPALKPHLDKYKQWRVKRDKELFS